MASGSDLRLAYHSSDLEANLITRKDKKFLTRISPCPLVRPLPKSFWRFSWQQKMSSIIMIAKYNCPLQYLLVRRMAAAVYGRVSFLMVL